MLVEGFCGYAASALGWLLSYAALGGVTGWLAVRYPSPMTHMLRWRLLVLRYNQSPWHLREILEPRDDERIPEIGPGRGLFRGLYRPDASARLRPALCLVAAQGQPRTDGSGGCR